MKGILFIGGEGPEFKYIKSHLADADLIIAADSGYDNAKKINVSPDIIIGDMDSISNINDLSGYNSENIIKVERDKDETDTELAIKYLKDHNFNEIIIVGGGGGRMDHFLAIVLLFDREFSPDIWYSHNTRFQKISGSNKLPTEIGKLVSFFPTGKGVCRMISRGLKWPLTDLIWRRGDMGISNIATENVIYIKMLEGSLIMVNELKDRKN
jgi:thiamine pyrophosphokinase